MKPHYYVSNRSTKFAPTYQHKTLAEATTEAERLAEKHPGTSFEILQCLGVSSVPKASTVWMAGVESEPVDIGWLDAEIEKASSQYTKAVADIHEAESECRSTFCEQNRAIYHEGRRDALTALKNSLK